MEGLSSRIREDLRSHGIRMVRDRIPPKYGEGLIIWGGDAAPVMIVDERVNDVRRENEICVHELMHYERGDENLLEMPVLFADYCESRVRDDTFGYCVSLERLAAAYEGGCREIWEFAEMLEVTDETFRDAIEHFRNVYGPASVRRGKWTFTFDPLRIRRAQDKSTA